jgi:hypothetical protein
MAKLDILSITYVARDLLAKGHAKGFWEKNDVDNSGNSIVFVCTEGAFNRAVRLAVADEISATPTICSELNALPEREKVRIVERMSHAIGDPRAKAIHKFLANKLGVASIPAWNDSASRTKEEVLALVDAFITDLEGLRPEDRSVEEAELVLR